MSKTTEMLDILFKEFSHDKKNAKIVTSKPQAYVSNVHDGFPNIVKNTYLFIKGHAKYDTKMTKLVKEFVDKDSDEWTFAELMAEEDSELDSSHTAKEEHNVLDTPMVYTTFRYEDELYVIIRLHNENDPKNGYTEPMAFIVYDDIHDLTHDMCFVGCSCDCSLCEYDDGKFINYDSDVDVNKFNFPNIWRIDGIEIKCTKCNNTVHLY